MAERFITRQTLRNLVLTFCLVIATVSLVQSAPRLTMYEDAFNFGYIPRNIAVSHDFWLFSTGDEQLLVLQVVPGCSCTQMPLEKKVIPVGDSARLEIVFHSRTMTHGLTKRPTITTNEGPEAKTLQIISYVVTNPDSTYPITIHPWEISVDGTPETPAGEQTFMLTNLTDVSLKVSIIDAPDEYAKVDFPDEILPKESAKGVVRVKKEMLKKSFEKSVTFELNDKDKSRFTLPIKRIYKGSGVGTLEDTVKQIFKIKK